MKIHNLVQGSPEWQQYRLDQFGASEAAAMLGISTRVTRNELLHMKATGTPQEFSEWVQVNIMDYGHEVEALARPLAEDILGEALYPVTCSDGRLSASCDGLTIDEITAFEHKQWNAALADAVASNRLPDEYQPQCQQIMMVTPATRVLFVVSDGTRESMLYMWVYPDEAWAERIRAGWEQFGRDLATYEPTQYAAKLAGEPIKALPALAIRLRGEVVDTNLPLFKAKADAFIAAIKTDLLTDEDFANAEVTIKFCEDAEASLDQAKKAAIAQTASIDELMRTVDHIAAQLREKRLLLTRTVKDKKELIKAQILANVKQRFADHVAALDAELAPLRLVFQARDFAGAMKNKRTLATLQNAVDTELANGKISVDALGAAWRARLAWFREHAAVHQHLFADLQQLIQKPDDDFKMVVNMRIESARKAEEEKLEAERARVIEQERARADQLAAAAAPEGAPLAPAAAPIEQVSRTLAPEVAWPFPSNRKPAAAPAGPPSLKLGQIAERLGFALTADFLGTLGFVAQVEKGARLYHEADFPNICAALQRHISAVLAQQLVAA